MGYIFSIITSVFFTLYIIPKKLSKQTPVRYSLFQGIGFFAGGAVGYLLFSLFGNTGADTLANPYIAVSAAAGVVWFAASMFFLTGIDRLGLSRSNQWKNLQGPAGAILSLIFLSEHTQTKLVFVILAILFILGSALLLNISDGKDKKGDNSGILYSLLSAVLFGIYATLQKFGTNKGLMYSQLFMISLAVMVSAMVYITIREKSPAALLEIKNRECIPGLAGGVLFYFTAVLTTISYRHLPASIAFTIIQLNALWTVLAGVLIFHETSFKKNWQRIISGLVFAVAGVIMLLFAQR